MKLILSRPVLHRNRCEYLIVDFMNKKVIAVSWIIIVIIIIIVAWSLGGVGGINRYFMSYSEVVSFLPPGGVYNVTGPVGIDEIPGLATRIGVPYFLVNNVTDAWKATYFTNQSRYQLIETIFQTPKPTYIYYKYTLGSPWNVTNTTLDGMTYSYIILRDTGTQVYFVGYKGDYVATLEFYTNFTVNITKLAATISGDLP